MFVVEQEGKTGLFWNEELEQFVALKDATTYEDDGNCMAGMVGAFPVEVVSYKPAVFGVREKQYSLNGLRFSTIEEATREAKNIFSRWFGCEDWCVVASDEEPNAAFEDGKLVLA